MDIILVNSGEITAVYQGFYGHILGTYKTEEGLEGALKVIGVKIEKEIECPNPQDGKLIDKDTNFPYHINNLPKTAKLIKRNRPTDEKQPRRDRRQKGEQPKAPEPQPELKPDDDGIKKAGRRAKRPPK